MLVKNGWLVFEPKDPIAFHAVMPHAKRIEHNDKEYLALEHSLDVVQILRNMGVNAPSPVNYGWEYPGRYEPYPHQKDTVDFLTVYRRCFVLNGMGTMKTCSAIWAAEYLMQQKAVNRVLVVAPRSCLHTVWADEIFNTTMHRSVAVLQGTRDKRRELCRSSATYLVINHDGVGIVADLIKQDKSINLVIIDESAAYRNGMTEKYKHLKTCLRPDMRLWLMSGAPCPNAPTDAWAQARLVKPENVPPYFTAFKRQTMDKINIYKWIPRHDSAKTVHKVLQPAIRFKKTDCVSLPPITYQNRECELTQEQKKCFKEMRRDLHTQHQGGAITAANAAVKLGKLLQICCGVVYDNTGVSRVIRATPRLDALMEIISECEQKVIVWVPYVSVIAHLLVEIDKKFGANTARGITGKTSDSARREIFSIFQDKNSEMKVLVAHPGTAAHGLTLVSASICIWYAPFFSPELYVQANERINRPGQENPMTILHLGSTGVEWGAYNSVRNANERQNIILDLYKNIVIDTN